MALRELISDEEKKAATKKRLLAKIDKLKKYVQDETLPPDNSGHIDLWDSVDEEVETAVNHWEY